MKIRKQLILPFTLIILLVLYLVINSNGKMNYEIPVFEHINTENISNIRIEKIPESINIYSENNEWRVGDDRLRAEISKITEMLTFLVEPEFIDMVSDTENYQYYGLEDGEYTRVIFWQEGQETPDRELFIGTKNTTGNFTYIRKPDNPGVFTVSGNIKDIFDIPEKDLLDKRVINTDISNIDRIILTILDSAYTLEKTVGENNEDIWSVFNNFPVDINILEQNLRYLSNSRFNSYIDRIDNISLENLFKIELFGENINDSFTILNTTDTGYYCKSTFTVKNFILSEITGTQIIKMFKELVELQEI